MRQHWDKQRWRDRLQTDE